MAREKYDWLALSADYIQTQKTLTDIAAEHKISYRTLSQRAKKDNWKEQREKYRHNVVKKSNNEKSSDIAKKIKKIYSASDKILNRIQKIICAEGQLNCYLYPDQTTGKPTEINLKKINTKELRETATALKDITIALNTISPLSDQSKDNKIQIVFGDKDSEDYSG